MIPFNLLGRVGNNKLADNKIREHDTDIQRLWQAIKQVAPEGLIVGNDPSADVTAPWWWSMLGGGGGSVTIYEGQTTSMLSAPSNGKTSPTTCTAQAWDLDPSGTPAPPVMVNSGSPVTLTNRDKNLSLVTGTYVMWFTKTLADGSTENRICYWSCP